MNKGQLTSMVFNEWEMNYLISVITGSWLGQKAALESIRKEAIDCKDERRKTWHRMKLNSEIFKFNLLEGLLAKLKKKQPNFEELVDEEAGE